MTGDAPQILARQHCSLFVFNDDEEREESEKEVENLREGMGKTDGDSQQHSSPKESQNRPTSERSPEGEDHNVVAT